MDDAAPLIPSAPLALVPEPPVDSVPPLELPRMPQAPVDFPGKIAYANQRGMFQGTLVREFKAGISPWTGQVQGLDENINEYFRQNGGLLTVDVHYHGDRALVWFTKQLSSEQLEDVQAFAREIDAKMEQRKAQREAAKEKAEEDSKKHEAENLRLIALGRKFEAEDFGNRVKVLSAERKMLRKALAKAGVEIPQLPADPSSPVAAPNAGYATDANGSPVPAPEE